MQKRIQCTLTSPRLPVHPNPPKKTKKPKKTTVKKVEKKIEKKEKSVLEKAAILQKDIKLKNEDKMLQKVERYVDKNREKTSQEIMERKSKRPNVKYNAADLEVMISRVSAQSKPKEKEQPLMAPPRNNGKTNLKNPKNDQYIPGSRRNLSSTNPKSTQNLPNNNTGSHKNKNNKNNQSILSIDKKQQ